MSGGTHFSKFRFSDLVCEVVDENLVEKCGFFRFVDYGFWCSEN